MEPLREPLMKTREPSASKVPSFSFPCPARRSATALPVLTGGCLAMRARGTTGAARGSAPPYPPKGLESPLGIPVVQNARCCRSRNRLPPRARRQPRTGHLPYPIGAPSDGARPPFRERVLGIAALPAPWFPDLPFPDQGTRPLEPVSPLCSGSSSLPHADRALPPRAFSSLHLPTQALPRARGCLLARAVAGVKGA